MRRGVVYTVMADSDDPWYADAAERSKRSLEQASPGIPAVIYEGQGPDAFRDKILAAQSSEFEQTLFLDSDTFITGDLGPVFDLLDRFDVAAAHAAIRISTDLEDVPGSFPELNTGVIAFRRSEAVSRFLDEWLAEYDRLLPLDPMTKDQPSFRRALYRSSLRIATLTPEWNQRFWFAGYLQQPVRILHGWPNSRTPFERVAAAMVTTGETGDWRVFSGGRVFRDGEPVAQFS